MSGSRRESVGKKDAKKNRREGRVPCVIYGGKEEIHFAVDEAALSKLLFTPETYFIKMNIDGSEHDCIIKDVQYHPVSDRILHADFLEFTADKPVTTSIPVKVKGTSPGVIKGGQLVKKFRKLTVTALPANMPQQITVDISKLELHDKVLISQIKQDKFEIKERGDQFVLAVRTTRLAASTRIEGEEEEEEAVEGAEEGAAEEGAAGEGAAE